ncbi:formate transporter FocA [Thalassotalea aquiviva]|uniref:formate transporter FocA n=1 Tax=Thalassotalea aquiviva TaxID=3242415 RepID=UPI00352B67DE
MSKAFNEPYITPAQMMDKAAHYAVSKSQKSTSTLLALSIMAGVFIGLAFIFYITVTTGNNPNNWGSNRLVGGLVFSSGLIFVVLCGGELFTSSVLSIIAVANKQMSVRTMLGIWAKVYLGNFIGASLLLILVSGAALYQLDGGLWGLNTLNIAQHKLHHSPLQAFSLGVLCNLMVCLAIWLTFCTSNALTKVAVMILPVALFVSTGFEHCIANMFLVPLGIIIEQFAPNTFWAQLGVSKHLYSDLTLFNFVTANLIPVTLGNIFGGAVLVGLSNWAIYLKSTPTTINNLIKTSVNLDPQNKEYLMNNVTLVRDIMQSQPIVFSAETHISAALDTLLNANSSSAPVCDREHNLVGFLSTHDILVNLWCKDYQADANLRVADLMNTDIVTVNAQDTLEQVLEFMCIDKEQLYPTTDFAMATQMITLPLEQRAKKIRTNKPHNLPVVDQGKLVGVISRVDIMKALRPVFGYHIQTLSNDGLTKEIA